MPEGLEELKARLREFFEERGDEYSVRWALLFGSASKGLKPLSDVDIMVKFGRKLRPYELGSLIAELEVLVGKEIDLVDFERAPPSLRYEVMNGVRLYIKDMNEFLEDYVKSVNAWLDFKPVWERTSRSYLCRLLGRSRGR